MHPPDYFDKIERNSLARWKQLEGDPELAGPWHQLFSQVQSPPHVLSELLQNADDAGARKAIATLSDGVFTFEHDGADFNADQFGSLCRFAFSNKRTIHTIGFRGVGFKSTFSLGDVVEVRTPTLAVQFNRARFTLPVWVAGAAPASRTIIRIRISDKHRLSELEQSLRQWSTSAASLLFFRSLERLEINGRPISKRSLGEGPVPDSTLWALTHVDGNGRQATDELFVFKSKPEAFPADSVQEIRRERNIADMHLPPCQVEVVLGLSGQQKAFVVLPTGAILDLPFSINAPFLQDPARFGIKEPSTSPTNRWLLERAGHLVADILVHWVARQELSIADRARAYRLLPKPDVFPDTENGRIAAIVRKAAILSAATRPVILLSDGQNALPGSCYSLPPSLYSVWSEPQHAKLFGAGISKLLSEAVSSDDRKKLATHGWAKSISSDDVVNALVSGTVCPEKPSTWAQLHALWTFVAANTNRYDGKAKLVRIIPVAGSNELSAPGQTVRLPSRNERLSPADWQFVMNYARTVDTDWLDWLTQNKRAKADGKDKEDAAVVMLSELGLHQATAVDTIVAKASARLFAEKSVPLTECVRFAHILAALEAKVPQDFHFVTQDLVRKTPAHYVVFDPLGEAHDLAPAKWSEQHLLHDDYTDEFVSCTAQQWETWINSGASGLHRCIPVVRKDRQFSYSFEFGHCLKERGVAAPTRYPYQSGRIVLEDWGFDDEILHHWNTVLASKTDHWARVLKALLLGPAGAWAEKLKTSARQHWGSYSKRIDCDEVPAEWLALLRAKHCLPDTRGVLRLPAELLLRTADTEPLRDIEPFIDAVLDTPGNRPLLEVLGVRSSPSSPTRILERLAALTQAPHPLRLVVEVNRLYEALDRIIGRCAPGELKSLAEAFAKRALILTESGAWVSSGEISVFSDEDKIAPAIHHAFQRLPMWPRLGVPERPAFERSLGWLQSLPSGGRIDAALSARVRSILQREPRRVWLECKHWLSLDQTWEPTTRLVNGQTMQNLGRWEGLAPAVKRATADLRMLPELVCEQSPFAELRDLQEIVEFRVTDFRPAGVNGLRTWIGGLADGLCRVKFSDEERMERVRLAARRLANTAWKGFSLLEVTPYVDGTPSGAPSFPRVLWQETELYVTGSVSVAKLHRDLADELSRPFADRSVAEAISACIERSPDYIAEYLADQFELEERATIKVSEPEQTDSGKSGSAPSDAGETPPDKSGEDQVAEEPPTEDESDNDTPDDDDLGDEVDHEKDEKKPGKPAGPPEPTLIEAYTKQRGFRWQNSNGRFVHPDGRWLEKAKSPFNWIEHRADGTVAARIWVSDQRLANGIEVAAELWGLAIREPTTTAIVIHGNDHTPCFLSAQSLLRLKDEQKIAILPSRFRIVEASK
jgi:hypothetical protein